MMKKIYTIDTETFKKEDDGYYYPILDTDYFVLGGLQIKTLKDNNVLYQQYIDKEEMCNDILNIINNDEGNCYIYGHNMEFDFYAIFKHALKELITSGAMNVISTTPFIAIYRNNKYFLDTMNYFPMSLEETGKMIGLEKLKMPDRIKEISELNKYLKRDVEITCKAMESAIEMYKLMGYNPRKYITSSSTSMNCLISYITREGKAGYFLKRGRIHKNEENLDFIRQANRGGWNQAFQTGSFENATMLDLNAHYWSVMMTMPFPDLLKERRLTKEDIDFIGIESVLQYIGVSRAIIKVPKIDLGILGVRYKPKGERIYKQFFVTNGEIIEGTWLNEEIRLALENGYEILELSEAVIWEKEMKWSPLKGFIGNLWEMKQKVKGDKLKEHFLKLNGNGLYGKFIQKKKNKQYKWVERRDINEWLEKGWQVESAADDYCISKIESDYIPKYLSVILGVMIAGYGRIRLFRHLRNIEEEDRVYCDTDSMMILNFDKYKEKLPIGEGLGEFKIEELSKKARVLGEKTYYIGEKIKIAGLPRREHSKEVLDLGLPVETKRMIGLGKAIQFGGFETVGKFETVTMEYSEKAKKDFILPEYIREEEI